MLLQVASVQHLLNHSQFQQFPVQFIINSTRVQTIFDPNLFQVRNYCCHASLLELSSSLFYEDKLVACAAADAVAAPAWDFLLSPDHAWEHRSEKPDAASVEPTAAKPCPNLLFVGVKDQQETDAPSNHNPHEVMKVVELVVGLLQTVSYMADVLVSGDLLCNYSTAV